MYIENILRLRREIIDKEFTRMNPQQKEAVYSVNGPVLILAGAGSGKTTVIINRIAYMIKYGNAYNSDILPDDVSEKDEELLKKHLNGEEVDIFRLEQLLMVNPINPFNIMAITFTNKAAGELKERLENILGVEATKITASTFHSACVRILRRYADKIGYSSHFTIYDTDDSKRLMKDCQKTLNIDDKLLSHKVILSYISRAKDSLIDCDEFYKEAQNDFRLKKVAEAYRLYQKRLIEADAMDFDDIICNTVRLFEEFPDVLQKCNDIYKYIMVDEYQDTNHAQYRLVRLLAGKYNNICVVGDDNQSIYRFRGATIENILSFEKQYKNVLIVRLEQNYRSTGNILNAANNVIKNNKTRKDKNLWTDYGDGDKIQQYTSDDEYGEAKNIAEKILDLVNHGDHFNDCAVLYRMNALSGSIETVFARSGIPYTVIGGTKFYSRKEIKDVLAYLHIVSNPTDTLHFKRIINEPKRGIGDGTVSKIEEISSALGISFFEIISNADEYEPLTRAASKLKEFAKCIESLIEFSEEKPLHDLVPEVLEKTGYINYLMTLGPDESDRVENVKELVSSVIRYEEETDETPSLSGFLETISLITDIDDYNESNDTVSLMTLHSSKGLEFKNVFLVGMEEDVFPGSQSILAGESEIEEERRLAYVGITRAKRQLFITNANTRMLFGFTKRNRLSRFVSEIPEELLETHGVSRLKNEYDMYGSRFGTSSNVGGYSRSNNTNNYTNTGTNGFGSSIRKPTPTIRKPSPTTKSTASYAVGEQVKHKVFGVGTILQVEKMAGDSMLTIQFENNVTKKLMANFAKLEKTE